MVVLSIEDGQTKGGRQVAVLRAMEAARQRMLQARRLLDDYDKQQGTVSWQLAEHTRLADDLIHITDEYIRLVTEFLYESSSSKRRHAQASAA